jgi:hypothetical protein
MIDTNAELDFEKRAALLTNSGYFDRVRELCGKGNSVKDAWEQVESGELPLGLPLGSRTTWRFDTPAYKMRTTLCLHRNLRGCHKVVFTH